MDSTTAHVRSQDGARGRARGRRQWSSSGFPPRGYGQCPLPATVRTRGRTEARCSLSSASPDSAGRRANIFPAHQECSGQARSATLAPTPNATRPGAPASRGPQPIGPQLLGPGSTCKRRPPAPRTPGHLQVEARLPQHFLAAPARHPKFLLVVQGPQLEPLELLEHRRHPQSLRARGRRLLGGPRRGSAPGGFHGGESRPRAAPRPPPRETTLP